jgi:non-ribosomal peptide synthetase component F
MLVEAAERGGEPARQAAARLRLVMLSGDWIPLPLPGRIQELWPECRVISLGGATEASIWSIFHPIEQVGESWKSIPYGQPLANQRFHILDAEMRPRPAWVPGQLYIAGRGLALGYWRKAANASTGPAISAATFPTAPSSSSAARTPRSRFADTASNSAKSRRCWPSTRKCGRQQCWLTATTAVIAS